MSDSLEDNVNCVECGFLYSECICNITDEFDDGDESDEF